ncbi:tail needle knob protein [Aeromonas hydrophila]|uniref:tail needle knob protein n=1 Tax=Aeromonas hydrophila TaxID=644 RepID=UPI000366DF00|nr:tail needle knob protein [Aeromonas hydrophila]
MKPRYQSTRPGWSFQASKPRLPGEPHGHDYQDAEHDRLGAGLQCCQRHLNLEGSWTGGSTNRSMQLDFAGTNGNRLVASRDVAVTSDVITLATFFSIDKNGFIALNGTKPVIRSNGGTFNLTGVLLIAEQITTETVISAV